MTDDMYALMEWLEGESLKAHNAIPFVLFAHRDMLEENKFYARRQAFDDVISHIRNGSKKELHRTLTEKIACASIQS